MKESEIQARLSAVDSYIKDCYFRGGYRGCSYFYGAAEPEIWAVCDKMDDGRYTVGRIKYLGEWYPSDRVYNAGYCDEYAIPLGDGVHLGIHTGVEGLGWTDYEYGWS